MPAPAEALLEYGPAKMRACVAAAAACSALLATLPVRTCCGLRNAVCFLAGLQRCHYAQNFAQHM